MKDKCWRGVVVVPHAEVVALRASWKQQDDLSVFDLEGDCLGAVVASMRSQGLNDPPASDSPSISGLADSLFGGVAGCTTQRVFVILDVRPFLVFDRLNELLIMIQAFTSAGRQLAQRQDPQRRRQLALICRDGGLTD